MNKTLLVQSLIKLLSGLILLAVMIFLPAGSLAYWQGWLLIGILFIPMTIVGIILMVKNPDLLRKRLDAKEKEQEQKTVVALSGLLFIAAFITAGLNWRFGWWLIQDWVVWVSSVFFIGSYLLYAEVLRENTYLSRKIEVQQGQQVIDTGLYGIVRHPMYMATIVLFLSMQLVLASPISFLVMLGYIPIIAKRINHEEQILEDGLEGYREYKKKVRYKIIPGLW